MSDLIKRSQIYNYTKTQINPFGKPFEGTAYEFGLKVMEFIKNMPSAEVPERGEWIYENYTWHCGKCGFRPFKGYIPAEPGFNFCPNCGVDMRKKV